MSDPSSKPEIQFDADALESMNGVQRTSFLLSVMNQMAGDMASLKQRIQELDSYKGDSEQPNIHTEFDPEDFDVEQIDGRRVVTLDDDAIQQRFAGGGLPPGQPPGITSTCPEKYVDYNSVCVERPGLSPLIIFFQIKVGDPNSCLERVRTMEICCVTCAGSESGSGSYTHSLDQWAGPCSDTGSGSGSDGTNFVYLPDWVFDQLSTVYDDPIVQLDGAGFCYQLLQRNVTAIETAFTTFNVMDVCTDSLCEDAEPCGLLSPQPAMSFVNNNNGDFSVASAAKVSIAFTETTVTIVWEGLEASGNGDYGKFTMVFTDPEDGNPCTVALSHSRFDSGDAVIETVLTSQNVSSDISAVAGKATGVFTIGDLVYNFNQ